jgi:hypothetical protein
MAAAVDHVLREEVVCTLLAIADAEELEAAVKVNVVVP